MTGSGRRRPRRITLVNQFYPPDVSPTAHLAASLAEHLAAGGDDVTVVTGGEGYVEGGRRGRPRPSSPVRVVELWTPAMGKASIAKRLADYVSFLGGATLRLATMRGQDVVIAMTTPPFVVVAAVVHRILHRRSRVVLWSMDCYPDVIERLGSRTSGPPGVTVEAPTGRAALRERWRDRLRPVVSLRRGGPASNLLRAVNRWAFRRVDLVVALDEAMRDLLLDGYGSADGTRPPSRVIPNWEDRARFAGADEVEPWSGYADPALADRFVVLYLGNLGYGHPVRPAVAAAARLDDAGVAWLFVGGGARWDELEQAARKAGAQDRIVRRPYVDRDATREIMAGAGCALILLDDDALGLMSPSKLHANLAAGLPILYVGPAGSSVDAAIERFGCGVSLRSGDVDGLVAAVERLRDDAAWRAELSAGARRAFAEAYCDEAALPLWDAAVDGVLS
ncbi:MAG: glycosyltransferase family 4 protein [Acidimicrobiales bacterium]|nr:glycosyltransferase family 4 protein [Acidimicrobiales bacterium]